MKKTIIIVVLSALAYSVRAQQLPANGFENAVRRSDFATYSMREQSAKRYSADDKYRIELDIPSAEPCASGLKYVFDATIPPAWLERSVYLATEGGRNSHTVYVNGTRIGSARDSRLPSEFRITDALAKGSNRIEIVVTRDTDEPESATIDKEAAPLRKVTLSARPQPCVMDFTVTSVPDSTGAYGLLTIDAVVFNPYNYPEPAIIGYDIYSPEKQLKHYDFREASVPAAGYDTVRFQTPVYGALERLWSDASPKLYELTIITRRDGIITEYIPVRVGFTDRSWDADGLIEAGRRIELKPVRYNSAPDAKTTEKDLKAIKKRGYNTVYPDYPQPVWFYDLTDRLGIYVVDQADINSSHLPAGKQIGGSLANDPRWLDEYMGRVEGMFYRTRNHPSVIAWSLGGPGGNGYNMYKAYQWLREQDTLRPVVFRGAQGEWNSDINLPEAAVFDPSAQPTGRRRK